MTRRELLLNYGVLTNGWSSPKIKKRKFLNEVANTEKKTHIRRHTEQRHDIVLLLSTWYNVAACVVVLWPKSLFLSRMKNQRGHWVCWMSTSRENGVMWRTHRCLYVYHIYGGERVCCAELASMILRDNGFADVRRPEQSWKSGRVQRNRQAWPPKFSCGAEPGR